MTMTVMEILHQGGGAGSVFSTLHLSIGLARRGLAVRFVCPPDSAVEAEARAANLEVHPLALRPHQRRQNAAAIAALLARYPVDLINSQSARDREALTWLGLTRRLWVPLIVTRRQMPRTFFLENWLASRVAARVVAVSQAVADALAARGTPRNRVAVIHNGLITARIDRPVSPEELASWRHQIGWRADRPTLGIVARLKDQEVVLRALDRVATPVALVIVGVPAGSSLEPLAAQVPQRHQVKLLPFTPDVRPLYDLLDLVLLPSRMEGFSQSLLEAMALGRPVIASGATGNLEMITPESDGLLVPPADPAAWAAAIERLIADPALRERLGAAARRTARERFSLDHTVERTAQLYRDVLAEVGASRPIG
ncbi:MAG TPA: glycosyltransferase family 4 protein [Gemmatimonadales bacterium]|nr:glycosyltransferase family 4 protein [Gemmatimonadales bacterium]